VSRSLSRWQAVLLGLVVLIGLGLGGLGLFLVGSHTWFAGDSLHVRAGFKGIQGVEEGTRVRVQGINAGQVVSIQQPATPGGDVVLRMRLDAKMRPLIRSDATVQIVGDGMIGGKVVEINPGTEKAPPVQDDAVLASRPTTELTEVLDQARTVLKDLHDGEGEVGKGVVATLDQVRAAADSFARTSDAVRKLPLVNSYDVDARTLLDRPGSSREVIGVFPESEMFEPGRAVLTAQGEQRLDGIADRIKGFLGHSGADLVVAATADPATSPDRARARMLSEAQSAAVLDYLKTRHSVHKYLKVPWYTVKPVGLGTDPYPGPPPVPNPPPARVEVLVFVPHK
jgi:phospholipid/cholesterol/gamma-HCH transport system substrate-binding protein